MMNPFRRTRFQPPGHAGVPFYYTPGPVFTEPAMAAIYHTTLQWPAQRILGGGYPIERFINPEQPFPLFAQPASTTAGVGIQAGQYALPPLTDDLGNWTDGVDTNPQDFSSAQPYDYPN
jgi:hypothetical protein